MLFIDQSTYYWYDYSVPVAASTQDACLKVDYLAAYLLACLLQTWLVQPQLTAPALWVHPSTSICPRPSQPEPPQHHLRTLDPAGIDGRSSILP